jgi:hypothetical protein
MNTFVQHVGPTVCLLSGELVGFRLFFHADAATGQVGVENIRSSLLACKKLVMMLGKVVSK